MSMFRDVSAYVPWYLACNKERFPYWYGAPDPRNKDFVKALTTGHNTVSTNKKLLFFKQGCLDDPFITSTPCIGSFIKQNVSLNDPGAGVWTRRFLVQYKPKNKKN